MADVLVDVVSRAGSGRPTVLCVPHAGAGAGAYSRWGAILELVADLTIARLPGREDLCFVDPLATLSEITTAIAGDLAGRAPGPLVLYGHCTGGLLAYELAHTLRTAGQTVDRLVVSSAPRPGTTPPDRYLHRLGDDGLKAYMVGFAGGDADEVDDELWELVEPAIRADLVAAELGQYTVDPLDVPVAAIRGASRRHHPDRQHPPLGRVHQRRIRAGRAGLRTRHPGHPTGGAGQRAGPAGRLRELTG